MNTVEFSELTTSQLVLIDTHCTQYEQALRKKQAIPLEQMLVSVSADIQRPLFKELFYQNLAYRRQLGESINRDEYTVRFPDFVDLIDDVWVNVFTFKEIPADTNNTDKLSLNLGDGLTIRGYKIKTRLARGGMGVVYLAQDMKLNREVAIKMLSSDNMSQEQTERFQMEARAISALQHQNIIQIFSVGEHHGQPYLVLEYADAGTLKERLEKTTFQRDQVLETMLILVKTIVFVHEKGFLHRDLKPSNILFDHEDNIKISDFGLAKDMSATELTHTQNLMGTPAYMAPEQVDKRFGNISELSDIYSLGVLLHSLLTSVTPYDGLSAPELLKELTSEKDVPKTHLLEHNIDKALMTVCLRCLEKQPRHRYQSATALFDDLKRLQSGQAVSRQTPYKKYIDRYLAPVIFGAVLLTGFGYLLERTLQTTVEINERSHLLGSKVIGQLEPDVLTSVNADYQGEDNFKLVNLLPIAVSETTDASLKSPQGLALYQDRYLYIADTLNHRVLMIDLKTGDIAHVAGSGESNYSGDNGLARNATLNQPTGLDVDANGNLYITDRGNHAVRVVNSDGIITTLSGGLGCREQLLFKNIPDLCYPSDVSVVSANEYFIADAFNQRIRYTDKKKTLFSVFKNKRPNTPTNFMPFPRAIAYDDGLLYFIEGHTGRLQKLDKAGTLTTLAEGFIEPTDISLDNKGNIYISDETGFPITRVDKISGEIEILAHEKLFARSANSPKMQTTTAITISSNNRVFFSNAIDNSIAVIIPRDDELDMIKRNEKNSPRHIQYPLTRLDDTDRYNYFDVGKPEIFSDIAHRLGLHLYIHHVSIGKDGYTLNQERLTARELLILTCMAYNVTCGIEGNTLFVAAPDIFPSITSAKPLQITNPLSYISNADSMPASLKQEIERDIKIETGVVKLPNEYFSMLDELSLFEFEIDPSFQHTMNANLSLEGSYNLGQLLTLFVLLEKFRLNYDEISEKIVVNPWQKQE